MPATCPAYLIHSTQPVYQFGLTVDLPHTFLHSIKDTANRQRQTVMDENLGMAIYEGFYNPSINYAVSCHVRKQAGLQNEHPGRALNAAAVGIVVGPEAPFRFSTYDGEFILSEASRERNAGEFHAVDFTVLHIFPEGATPSSSYPADIDRGNNPPIEVGGGGDGDGTIDPGTGAEALVALRVHYDFEPARGHAASARSGYVTRLMNRSSVPTLAQVYATNNPPATTWQSTYSDGVVSGPAYDADDTQAIPAADSIPGIYTVRGIWEATGGTWIYDDGISTETPPLWDTVTSGDQILVIHYNTGDILQLLGNFANLAAVLTHLGLGDATTLNRVYEARSNTYYHGTAPFGIDEIAFWRATTTQPTAPQFFQLYELYGQRYPSTNFNFIRCSYNKFDPSWAVFELPDPPPPPHWNIGTTGSTNLIDSIDAVFCRQDATYDVGDATAVTALSYTAPSAGKDLWIFQVGSTSSPYPGQWDYIVGNIPNTAAFWAARGHSGSYDPLTPRYDVLYHANGTSGRGRYYIGNSTLGDPFLTEGLSLY